MMHAHAWLALPFPHHAFAFGPAVTNEAFGCSDSSQFAAVVKVSGQKDTCHMTSHDMLIGN